MPKKKRSKQKKKGLPLIHRIDLAWKNFVLFLILFILSFVLYSASSSDLLVNLFGILAIFLGFLSIAFLIVFVVLSILKSGVKKKKK